MFKYWMFFLSLNVCTLLHQDNSRRLHHISCQNHPEHCERTDFRLRVRLSCLNDTFKKKTGCGSIYRQWMCWAWNTSRKQHMHIFIFTNSCCLCSLSVLQHRSHIKTLVWAWRQWRGCCLFAEQLPLTETLILGSLHPPPLKPPKGTALYDKNIPLSPSQVIKQLHLTETFILPTSSKLQKEKEGICWSAGLRERIVILCMNDAIPSATS